MSQLNLKEGCCRDFFNILHIILFYINFAKSIALLTSKE